MVHAPPGHEPRGVRQGEPPHRGLPDAMAVGVRAVPGGPPPARAARVRGQLRRQVDADERPGRVPGRAMGPDVRGRGGGRGARREGGARRRRRARRVPGDRVHAGFPR